MILKTSFAFGDPVIHLSLEGTKATTADYLALMAANISEPWNAVAKCFALPALAESTVQVNTFYAQDGERNSDYQHLYAVIRRVRRDRWVFPKDRIIYEPTENDGMRYAYHPGQYKPAEIIIRISDRSKSHKWVLEHDRREPTYETIGNGNTSYIPVTNLYHMGADDVYAVFDYFHRCDLHHKLPIKVFYKTHDEYLKLHALSIPLELLGLALNDKDNSYDDDDRRSI
jgi:hypothetical protein